MAERIDSPLIDPSILGNKEATPAPVAKKVNKSGFYRGLGRRKSSVARVRIKPGEGKMLINNTKLHDYFGGENERRAVMSVLHAVKAENTFDIFVNVEGGGLTGQAGAILLGISRALKNYDINFLPMLRDGDFLTRDGRMKERKKYGQRGARRRFQFSKR